MQQNIYPTEQLWVIAPMKTWILILCITSQTLLPMYPTLLLLIIIVSIIITIIIITVIVINNIFWGNISK